MHTATQGNQLRMERMVRASKHEDTLQHIHVNKRHILLLASGLS